MVTIIPKLSISQRTEVRCTQDERDFLGDELAKTDFIQVGLFDEHGDYQLITQSNHSEYNGNMVVVIAKDEQRHKEVVLAIQKLLRLGCINYDTTSPVIKYV